MLHRILVVLIVICIPNLPLFGQILLRAPESVVYDSVRNRYLASGYTSGDIIAIDSVGQQSYFVRNQYCKNGLHIRGNIIYAACVDSGVKGFDLATGELVFRLSLDGMINLNDITSDRSGNLFVTDVDGSKIYRIRLSDHSYNVFHNFGTRPPNGVWFDERHHRLLVVEYTSSYARIVSLSLTDSTVTTLVITNHRNLDGITLDCSGNVYFSSWQTTSVYRYDSTFTNPATPIYQNPNGPADIYFNCIKNELAIPVMWSNAVIILSMNSPVDEPRLAVPEEIRLNQNYPNPFNPLTTISFTLPKACEVKLALYDVLGRMTDKACLVPTGTLSAGQHEIVFDGSDLPSGIYFARLEAGGISKTQKMILLK
jgi:hypothetical protein